MNRRVMTQKEKKDIDEAFELKMEAMEIRKLINAEWKSSPTSVQCFDLRVVKRTDELLKRLDKLGPLS